MKNQYISHFNRPSLSQLFQERLRKLPTLVNNLKFRDVEDEKSFESVKSQIKKAILIDPVVIGEPQYEDFVYEENEIRIQDHFFGNPSKDNYVHKISFPYEGAKELFLHTPDSFSYMSSDHGIIEPSYDKITVYVELTEINPDKAKVEAKSLLRLTNDIVEKNSESTMNWNYAVEKKIDEDLEFKKAELFRIFG